MAKDGNELLAQFAHLQRLRQPALAVGDLALIFGMTGLIVEMARDELSKKPKHLDDRCIPELCGRRVDCAQGSKERPIAKDYGHGNVALQAIEARRMMVGILRIVGDVVDDDLAPLAADFVTKRRPQRQLAARLQAEAHAV